MNRTIILKQDDIHRGDLILINRHYPMRNQNYKDKLVSFNIDFNYVQINYRLREQLIDIFEAIKNQTQIIPTSGFRSREEQKRLYEDSLYENGEPFTKAYVAYPGCSEHESGLAIDLAINEENIDLVRPSFPNTGISKQFKDFAVDYGIIERYEENKKELTLINAEEWHFRYVGYPHSKIMKEMDLCLEQYIEYIQDYKRNVNPYLYENYEISFLSLEHEELQVILHVREHYSGNNVNGFIFTRELI